MEHLSTYHSATKRHLPYEIT